MGWAKFDDNYTMNPKILAAGHLAELLDVRGIIWCARNETDGFVSREALALLSRQIPKVKEKAARLVEVGRWSVVDGGWMVLNFLDYNPSHAECEKRRSEGRERAQRSRERNAKQSSTCAVGSGDPRAGDGTGSSWLTNFAIRDCDLCDSSGWVLDYGPEGARKCEHGEPSNVIQLGAGA